jgi:hypothetical protein
MSDRGRQPSGHTGDSSSALTIQWVGDISFNHGLCNPQLHSQVRANLAHIAEGLGACDLRIGNWESPLWGDGGENLLKVPRLCTTAEAARCVLPLGLSAALLANNHAYDCLEQGFANTAAFLDGAGIGRLGAGRTPDEAARPLIVQRRGRRIGLLNYVAADTHPNLPPDARIHLNMLEDERLLNDVTALARDAEIVLVNLHWGVDMLGYPTLAQRRLARAAIARGAACVVGHHAHCIQGHESWQNGHIFYGLGNFLFDDVGCPWPQLSRRSVAATCVVGPRGVAQARMTHVYQNGVTLEFDARPRRAREEARLNRPLSLPDDRYARFFRRAQRRDVLFNAPVRWMQSMGGPLRALQRVRGRHVARVLRALWPARTRAAGGGGETRKCC